jgi:hypothetical protein
MARHDLPGGQWVEVLDRQNNGQRKRMIAAMETAAAAGDSYAARLELIDAVMCHVITSASWSAGVPTPQMIDELDIETHDATAQIVNATLGLLLPDFGPNPNTSTPTEPSAG